MLWMLSLWLWNHALALTLLPAGLPETEKHSTLHVKISKPARQEGKLLIAVYGSAADLDTQDPHKARASAVLDASQHTGTEFHLPPGDYAVLVAHDLNGNHKLDRNWLGVPIEPVGISNGFKSKLRRPTFAECTLMLRQPRQQIEILLERF